LSDGITYANKDVLFKALSELYKNKSLAAYGLDIPRIKQMLPNNYPAVSANETRSDTPALLEDDSLLLMEYESDFDPDTDFIKLNGYALSAVKQLRLEGIKVKRVIIAVIYTADITQAPDVYDLDAICIKVRQVFLSKFDTDGIYAQIKSKIDAGDALTDEEMLKLIVLPLTQPVKNLKQKLIEDAVGLAKRIPDESQQLFAVAGILTATNKFIDKDFSNQVKEWVKMTKVARLFEEEKIEAVNRRSSEIACSMLQKGVDSLTVMECTGLTGDEVKHLQNSLSMARSA
jgi:hypothetical protein